MHFLSTYFVLGNKRFVEEVEALTVQMLKEENRGRAVGWRKKYKSCSFGVAPFIRVKISITREKSLQQKHKK
jgi:hypothetical protein